jgi:predicted P-type ATPase
LQAGVGGTSEVKAIVTATGMDTSKGKLLSTILFPEQMIFKYDEELPIVVLMLLCYAAVCFALSLVFQYRNGQQSIWVTKWSYCIAILSQTVSPLLPVALEIGQIYASVRLKNCGIFCVNPKRIAIAGKIRVFCFDKTGTLTKNGLDFIGVQGVVKHVDAAADGQPTIIFGAVQSPQSGVDMIDKLVVQGLATCHAVTRFGDQFVGNEVEVKMFSAIGWELLEGGTESQPNPIVVNKNGEQYTIVRRNEFEHSRATMSVVVQDSAGELHVFCKGSFEKIQEHSIEGSIPLGYLQTAKDHALGGCYVLGLSHKSLGTTLTLDAVKSMSRDNLERDLTFVSLLLFRNELKKDTRAAIEALREGQVRSLMVTGDNAQCGFYIAKECAMVAHHVQVLLADLNEAGSVVWQPMVTTAAESGQVLSTVDMLKVHGKGLEGGLTELAVTGKAFNVLCKTGDMNQLLYYTRIFARFTPEDKVNVVTLHRDRGLVVGMCGDGGNDCGALRSAHAGLALSEAEASVVSPFTSKSKSVASVVELLREGRAALHTSFACYKFLIIYGLSFSIFKLTANWYGAIPCQMDYLFIDGVAVLSLGYSMNLSNPQKKLSQIRPTSSLLGPQNVASVLGLWIVNVLFVLINLSYMHIQPDYVKWPAKYSKGNAWWVLGDNWESTVIFFTIYFQFITSAMVFSFGSAFRRPVVFNYRLLGAWTAIITLMSFVLLLPHSSFTHLWHVASEDFNGPNSTSPVWIQYQANGGAPSAAMPFSFRLHLWFLLLTNLVVIASWQKAVVEGPVAKFLRHRYPSSTPKFNL